MAVTVSCGFTGRLEHLIIAVDAVAGDTTRTFSSIKRRLLQESSALRSNHQSPLLWTLQQGIRLQYTLVLSPYTVNDEATQNPGGAKKYPHLQLVNNNKGIVADIYLIPLQSTIRHSNSDDGSYICLMGRQTLPSSSQVYLQSVWITDFGATVHMTYDRSAYTEFEDLVPCSTQMANTFSVSVHG